MNWCTVLALTVLAALVSVSSQAQIPRTISYQGVLCDAAGNPKPDNSYQMTFRIYEAEAGGTAVWTEQKALTVRRGLFSTLLGPFGPALAFDTAYWLSVQVESEEELSPRVPLSSVGYSLNAANADTATYALDIRDGVVTSGKLASGQVVKSINELKDNVTLQAGTNVSIGASGNTLTISANPGGSGNVTGTGSSGQIAFWTGSSNISGGSGAIWDNTNSRLGIGTATPSYPVHVRSLADWVVVGEATAATGEVWGGVFFSPNSSTGRGVYGGGNAIGVYGNSPATSGTNYGVYGTSYSSAGTGVYGLAQATSGATRGVSGESTSETGVGVYGSAHGNGTAVYAESKGGGPALRTTGGPVLLDGDVGIGTASPAAKLHVAGNMQVTGNVDPAAGISTDTLRMRATRSIEVQAGTHLVAQTGQDFALQSGRDLTALSQRDLALRSERAFNIDSGDTLAVTTQDNLTIHSGAALTIEALDDITILVGKASIVMKKNGDISIKGNNISIEASGLIRLKGSKIEEP